MKGCCPVSLIPLGTSKEKANSGLRRLGLPVFPRERVFDEVFLEKKGRSGSPRADQSSSPAEAQVETLVLGTAGAGLRLTGRLLS